MRENPNFDLPGWRAKVHPNHISMFSNVLIICHNKIKCSKTTNFLSLPTPSIRMKTNTERRWKWSPFCAHKARANAFCQYTLYPDLAYKGVYFFVTLCNILVMCIYCNVAMMQFFKILLDLECPQSVQHSLFYD